MAALLRGRARPRTRHLHQPRHSTLPPTLQALPMPPRTGENPRAPLRAEERIGDTSAGPRRAGQASATLAGVAPAPYENACEEAACGRRGNQSRSDAAAPAAIPPPHERGQSRLLRRARGRLRPSVRPASLITKQTAAPMIAAAGPGAPARAAPTTIAAPISAGIAQAPLGARRGPGGRGCHGGCRRRCP
jgi:hypothetical protein